jgi:TolB protein
MRMRRVEAIRTAVLWLAVLCAVMMISSTAGAAEVKVSAQNSDQGHPSISGDRIVWQDDRNGNWDIYLYDLGTGVERPICTAPGDQVLPSISGDRIVWQDDRNGSNSEVYLFDLTTGIERPIFSNGGVNYQKEPAIDGMKIVYMDSMNGDDYNIHLYDLLTQRNPTISETSKSQKQPAISGDYVAWIDYTKDIPNILYLYNISAGGDPYPVTNGLTTPRALALNGSRVVWSDDAGIFLYDWATKESKWLIQSQASQQNPVISGDTVIWEDDRAGTNNLYRYDLTTRQTTRLTNGPSSQNSASIDGNRVVYVDDRGQNPAIYMTPIESGQQPEAVNGQTKVPTDPNYDGLYEDMDGNGEADFNDVVIFFNQMDWIAENEPVSFFDFDHNGVINFNDIVMLFNRL